MYNFIEAMHPECMISLSDIAKVENKFGIKFPMALKNFYFKYNAAEISLCKFTSTLLQDEIFEVHVIYPIKYTPYENGAIFEKVISGDRIDGFISSNLIPFAEDRGGNRYYCDEKTDKVYFIPSDDIDNPLMICERISDFFDNLFKTE